MWCGGSSREEVGERADAGGLVLPGREEVAYLDPGEVLVDVPLLLLSSEVVELDCVEADRGHLRQQRALLSGGYTVRHRTRGTVHPRQDRLARDTLKRVGGPGDAVSLARIAATSHVGCGLPPPAHSCCAGRQEPARC